MTILATDSNRLSSVVKYEHKPEFGFCRDVITVYDSAQTLVVGAVLGKFIASPVGTAGATVGTGTGAMGAITMTSNANLVLGTYKLTIYRAVGNAGDFVLTDPNGKVVGVGQVAAAFSQGGFAFTLADATDFVVGDYIPIVVSGTEKYKLVSATATDGSEVARAVFIADKTGNSGDLAVTANTDTSVLALTRGPVIVMDDELSYNANVDSAAEIAAVAAQLKAVGIIVENGI